MSGYSKQLDTAQILENERWRLRWLRRLRALHMFSEQSVQEAEESVRRLEEELARRNKATQRGRAREGGPARNRATKRRRR
jgi:hypothetical protein